MLWSCFKNVQMGCLLWQTASLRSRDEKVERNCLVYSLPCSVSSTPVLTTLSTGASTQLQKTNWNQLTSNCDHSRKWLLSQRWAFGVEGLWNEWHWLTKKSKWKSTVSPCDPNICICLFAVGTLFQVGGYLVSSWGVRLPKYACIWIHLPRAAICFPHFFNHQGWIIAYWQHYIIQPKHFEFPILRTS